MFLDRLNENQQGVLLSLAMQLMFADGRQRPEETALIAALRRQVGAAVVPVQAATGELAGIYATRPARIALMLELMGVALVDREFHAAEQDFIGAVAQALQIGESELSDMQSWVARQFVLVREAESFLEA